MKCIFYWYGNWNFRAFKLGLPKMLEENKKNGFIPCEDPTHRLSAVCRVQFKDPAMFMIDISSII